MVHTPLVPLCAACALAASAQLAQAAAPDTTTPGQYVPHALPPAHQVSHDQYGAYYAPAPGPQQPLPATGPFQTAGAMNNLSLEQRVEALESQMSSGAQQDGDSGPKKVDIVSKPTFKVGGRVYYDNLWATQSAVQHANFGDIENRSRFDSVRLKAEGDIYENMDYRVQIAFGENADPVFKDVYMTVTELPVIGHVRAGHFKEPFSIDQMTSSRFITFMERNLADVFVPARNLGMMVYNDVFGNENFSMYGGVFRSEIGDHPPTADQDGSDWSCTGRMCWLPFYDEPSGGRYLVHLGCQGSWRTYGDNSITYDQDPGLDFANDDFVDLTLVADSAALAGVEAAAVFGPLSFQTEWIGVHTNGILGNADNDFNGTYFQCSYFLTGEHRGYKRSDKCFDRVHPDEPFFLVGTPGGWCGGIGAWEIAARYGIIDLNTAGVAGGRIENYTAGVNWYLNAYSRVMFNYIITPNVSLTGGAPGGTGDFYGMRYQIDF